MTRTEFHHDVIFYSYYVKKLNIKFKYTTLMPFCVLFICSFRWKKTNCQEIANLSRQYPLAKENCAGAWHLFVYTTCDSSVNWQLQTFIRRHFVNVDVARLLLAVIAYRTQQLARCNSSTACISDLSASATVDWMTFNTTPIDTLSIVIFLLIREAVDKISTDS